MRKRGWRWRLSAAETAAKRRRRALALTKEGEVDDVIDRGQKVGLRELAANDVEVGERGQQQGDVHA